MTFFETLCMLSAAHCTWAAAEASRHCEIWLYFFSFIAGIALATENAHSLFYNQQSGQLLCYIFVYKRWIQHYLDFWKNLIRKSIFRLPFANSCLKKFVSWWSLRGYCSIFGHPVVIHSQFHIYRELNTVKLLSPQLFDAIIQTLI